MRYEQVIPVGALTADVKNALLRLHEFGIGVYDSGEMIF